MSPQGQVLRGRVVTPSGVLDDAVVAIRGDRIAHVGPVANWGGELPAPVGTVLPGLVDVHCHGGGGHGFGTTDPVEALGAAQHHHRHGTTTVVASLVTAPEEVLCEQLATLRPLVASGAVAGVHLEGPFLSHARCGAQDPAHLVLPDVAVTRRLLEAGAGCVRQMTLAPELPGADEVAEVLRAAGVVVALGHSDADGATFSSALSGAGLVTHLGNALPPLHHREPGPVAAALVAASTGRVVVEVVADGVHTDDGFVALALAAGGPGQVAFVTDAMAAAGRRDGRYRLGSQDVVVDDGVARLAAGGAIAGGTSHLVDQLARAVAAGVPLADAVRAAATTPARVLGLDDVGALVAGRRADLLVLDDRLAPVEVLRAGQRLRSARSSASAR